MANNVHIDILTREYHYFDIHVYTKQDQSWYFEQLRVRVDGGEWTTHTPSGGSTWGLAPIRVGSNLNAHQRYTIEAQVKWVDTHEWGGIYSITAWTLGNGTITTVYPVKPDKPETNNVMNARVLLNIQAANLYYKLRIYSGIVIDMVSSAVQISSTGSSVDTTFVFSSSDRENAISHIDATSTKRQITLELQTYSDSACTDLVDSKSLVSGNLVLSEEYSKPTFSDFAFEDTVEYVTEITGNNQILLQTLSRLLISPGWVYSNNGANLSRFEFTVGRVTKTRSLPATTSCNITMNFGEIAAYGDSTAIKVRLTDSRGFSTTVTKTAKVIRYEKPKLSTFIVNREDEVEETIQLNIAGSISSIIPSSEEVNVLQTAYIYYKRVSEPDTEWQSISLTGRLTKNGVNFSYTTNELVDGSSTVVRFDENAAYNFRIELEDQLSYDETKSVYETVVTTATGALMILGRTSLYPFPRVGINTAKPTEALEVTGNIKLSGVIKTPTGQVMSYAGEVTDGSSFHSYKSTGLYFYAYNANTCVASNAPPVNAPGFLEVYATASGNVLQRFTLADGSAVYIETYYNSSWSNWVSL